MYCKPAKSLYCNGGEDRDTVYVNVLRLTDFNRLQTLANKKTSTHQAPRMNNIAYSFYRWRRHLLVV